ncbi:MAG: DUF4339 domain-containing protein [Xenococcus sp. (in: cyanobacteria)]
MTHWYYTTDGTTQLGPVSEEELKNLIRNGQLNRTSLVWQNGMEQWVYASTIPDLFSDVPPPLTSPQAPPISVSLPPSLPPNRNNSGQGKAATVPSEIKGWNWGAFGLSLFWSISNRVWIGLLSIIPYVGLVVAIVLGVKGNEWAWQSRKWDSVEQFQAYQKGWAIATGIAVGVGFIIGFLIGIAGG